MIFIYSCIGSLLLHGLSLVVHVGFSLQWLLLLLITGSRARRLQGSALVGSAVAVPEF